MKKWILQHKVPTMFIISLLVVALIFGISKGLSYLSAQRQEFIDQIAPAAMEGYNQYGILPSLTISQAILESGWGKYHISNNLFGIKATSSWTGEVAIRTTKEYINGQWVTIEAKFRAYPSFAESIIDYIRLIGTTSRYSGVLTASDYKEAAMRVWLAGYATDPQYPQKLVSIIESYNLDQYDIKTKNYKYFADVPDDRWYSEAINRLYERGIVEGVLSEDTLLALPNEGITRAELFVLLDRLASMFEGQHNAK
ncbi:MAG: glucosaminidase domain-containing protein [Dethiobacter sp.]|jgi:hypothetical protein|nr:glucosaminidase domain-containing protein [Dethiobacter sp.]